MSTKSEEADRNHPKEMRISKNNLKEQVINDIQKGVSTRSSLRNLCANLALFLKLTQNHLKKPKDEYWKRAMQDELQHFEKKKFGDWSLDRKIIA